VVDGQVDVVDGQVDNLSFQSSCTDNPESTCFSFIVVLALLILKKFDFLVVIYM
jgi:hypothetical protein